MWCDVVVSIGDFGWNSSCCGGYGVRFRRLQRWNRQNPVHLRRKRGGLRRFPCVIQVISSLFSAKMWCENGKNVVRFGGFHVLFRWLHSLFAAVPKNITDVFCPMMAKWWCCAAITWCGNGGLRYKSLVFRFDLRRFQIQTTCFTTQIQGFTHSIHNFTNTITQIHDTIPSFSN